MFGPEARGDVFLGGTAGTSGSSLDDEQQLRKAKSLEETLFFVAGVEGLRKLGSVEPLSSSTLVPSSFRRRDVMLLPLLRSLCPFRILLFEPRRVFSESSWVLSRVLSRVDWRSAFKEARDGMGRSKCLLELLVALPVDAPSAVWDGATGAWVDSGTFSELDGGEEALVSFTLS